MAESITTLRQRLGEVERMAGEYFDAAESALSHTPPYLDSEPDAYWRFLDPNLQNTSEDIQRRLLKLIGAVGEHVRASLLLTEADVRDLTYCAKHMRAALRFRKYRSWDTEVLHDEDIVLGVTPAGQLEELLASPADGRREFEQYRVRLLGVIDLLEVSPSRVFAGTFAQHRPDTASYKPNTAFVMMWIDSNRPELQDVYDTYRDCFGKFDIQAIRADDIEHEGVITDRIREEIRTSEFLLADLTGERPSVYYEVGYAHSLSRRVILFRKNKTTIHFDLAGYNCPEYENLRDLRDKLMKRLEQVTGRKPKV